MPVTEILKIAAAIGAITAVLWAIGRQGLSMGDVFRTLFSNGERRTQRGVQEDDDAWSHIREERRRPPTSPVTEERAEPVRTTAVHRSA